MLTVGLASQGSLQALHALVTEYVDHLNMIHLVTAFMRASRLYADSIVGSSGGGSEQAGGVGLASEGGGDWEADVEGGGGRSGVDATQAAAQQLANRLAALTVRQLQSGVELEPRSAANLLTACAR